MCRVMQASIFPGTSTSVVHRNSFQHRRRVPRSQRGYQPIFTRARSDGPKSSRREGDPELDHVSRETEPTEAVPMLFNPIDGESLLKLERAHGVLVRELHSPRPVLGSRTRGGAPDRACQ